MPRGETCGGSMWAHKVGGEGRGAKSVPAHDQSTVGAARHEHEAVAGVRHHAHAQHSSVVHADGSEYAGVLGFSSCNGRGSGSSSSSSHFCSLLGLYLCCATGCSAHNALNSCSGSGRCIRCSSDISTGTLCPVTPTS